jgi:hypothetical protein
VYVRMEPISEDATHSHAITIDDGIQPGPLPEASPRKDGQVRPSTSDLGAGTEESPTSDMTAWGEGVVEKPRPGGGRRRSRLGVGANAESPHRKKGYLGCRSPTFGEDMSGSMRSGVQETRKGSRIWQGEPPVSLRPGAHSYVDFHRWALLTRGESVFLERGIAELNDGQSKISLGALICGSFSGASAS